MKFFLYIPILLFLLFSWPPSYSTPANINPLEEPPLSRTFQTETNDALDGAPPSSRQNFFASEESGVSLNTLPPEILLHIFFCKGKKSDISFVRHASLVSHFMFSVFRPLYLNSLPQQGGFLRGLLDSPLPFESIQGTLSMITHLRIPLLPQQGPKNFLGSPERVERFRDLSPFLNNMTELAFLPPKQNFFINPEWGLNFMKKLASVLPLLPQLERLSFQKNKMETAAAVHLAIVLPHLSNLQMLALGGNHIKEDGMLAIATALPSLTRLQILTLGDNNIREKGALALASVLPFLPHLHTLDVYGNNIEGEGIVSILSPLSTLKHFRHLDLSINYIGDERAIPMAAGLKKLKYLQRLGLGSSSFSDRGALELAIILPELKNLQKLELYWNKIGIQGALLVIQALQNLPHFHYLDLSYNSIRGEGIENVSKGLLKLKSLIQLDLSVNKMGIEGITPIAIALSKLPNLQKVDLSFNTITSSQKLILTTLLKHLKQLPV